MHMQYVNVSIFACSQLNLKWKDLKFDFGPQNEHIRKRMAGRTQKNNPFYLVGPVRPI